MKRIANPSLSSSGEEAVAQYREVLWEHEDLTGASRRNYLSDLRHFAAWYEANCVGRTDDMAPSQTEFDPRAITTPALTRYRSYLQKVLCQKPNSVNRALISLKRYSGSASLFPSAKTKEALSERALGYIVKKYAEKAKIVNVSPHDLRHRFGYRMAESVPLHRLAQIMGHDSLDT